MVALAAGAAFAQDTGTAVLTGRVTAAGDNSPLAGVRVRIESPSMLGVRNATTDASGNFRVPLLPTGEYSVTYTLDGYISRKITMRLNAGQTANGNARLNAISAQEVSVEITTDRSTQIDKTDTVVATTFSSDYLEKIVGRNINSLGLLAPGINTSDLTTQGTLNIRGGTGRSTKTLLNGSSITEAYGGYNFGSFVIGDLVESLALIQSPLNTRYGNSDGGIITMVTSKGSNTFSGTLRVTGISRSYWSVLDQGYAQRDGTLGGRPNPSNPDLLSKSYELSIKGPLWKDHITFAYGGKLTPTSFSTPLPGQGAIWNTVQGSEVPYFPSSNTGRPSDKVGTFYEDYENGVIIRKPEMGVYNTPEGRFNATSKSVYTQVTLFGQITPNHQVEYNYIDNYGLNTEDTQGGITEPNNPWNIYSSGNQQWNYAYKGIIGNFGVLDVSYGKSGQFWKYADPANYPNQYPIRSGMMASRVPRDGNRNNNSLDNYWSNGFVWAAFNQTLGTANGNSSNFNQNSGWAAAVANGKNIDNMDASKVVSFTLNYQHFLKTSNRGSHMLDIGVDSQDFQWYKKAAGAVRQYYTPGMLAQDLTLADVYNPRGVPLTNDYIRDTYANKYIVFNVRTATLNDVDPSAVARFGLDGNRRFADYVVNGSSPLPGGGWGAGIPTLSNTSGNFAPRVYVQGGDADGTYNTNMMSYYLNDLWTINDNHSVQAGLRVDNFEVVSIGKTLFSYSQPTFRFEYKWDLLGDQSRMVNVSWGQFHSMQPAGLFTALVDVRGSSRRTIYWQGQNGNGSARPYLVDKSDILNPANYGLESDWWTQISGGSTLEDIPSYAGNAANAVDPNWRAPISTEFQLGFRRNLILGGWWKATFVYRTWINDFDYFPGDIIEVPTATGTSTQKTIQRVLKNTEGYERKYTGIELEWDYPIFKRVTFGGSYTFNRLMSNVPDRTDASGGNDVGNSPALNWDTYWDYAVEKTFGVTGKAARLLWRDLRPRNPEHFFKWYLLFDFSSGRINQSVAFRGNYTSGGYQNRTYLYRFGFPTDFDERYRELIQGTSGGNVSGTSGTNGFSQQQYIFYLQGSTAGDSWDVNMRYSLTMPISKRLRLLTNVDVLRPFNHRGLNPRYSYANPDDQVTIPYALTTGNAPIGANTPFAVDNDHTKNVWRSPNGATGRNDNFRARQSGRSMSIEAGLRF